MDRFAEVCEKVASHRSRLRKIEFVAEYLRTLEDADFARAVRFFCCAPVADGTGDLNLFGEQQKRPLSVGFATLREAYVPLTEWDGFTIGRCHEEVGDTGETIALLLAGRTQNQPLSLQQAEEFYSALSRCTTTACKIRLLRDTFAAHRPLAIKYLVKIITGDLRIGLLGKMVEEAVAASTGDKPAAVRSAQNRLGDLAQVALAARSGSLHTIEARLFHPMDYMLAKPLDSVHDLDDPANYWVEHKYDGIRSQVHLSGNRVAIYTRGMDEVTQAYPELVAAFKELPGSAVLDGEILAWEEGHALPFAVLQQRLGRKKVSTAMISQIPVIFMAYDILFRDGELLLDTPLEARRAALEALFAHQSEPLLVSPQYEATGHEDIDRLFAEARASINEGLVLKRRGSLYEPGRRSGTWYKVKRAFATLDVVITAAEQGNGKRASVLSDYTFAVRSGDEFVNVGKAYSGLTDIEIRELTRLLRAALIERYGRVLLVRPEIVLEVAFDGVQKSPRHKSGYALRFPRIERWRKDKTAEDIDTLERVAELYTASLSAHTR